MSDEYSMAKQEMERLESAADSICAELDNVRAERDALREQNRRLKKLLRKFIERLDERSTARMIDDADSLLAELED